MACILNIETATDVCSVVVVHNHTIIFEQVDYKGPSHAQLLGVFTENALKELRKQHISLDAIAVSCGPGSYTGLRIGVSHAKGLCFGLDIPLIALPTLSILADSIAKNHDLDDTALLCPMIDARRMEVYDALFDTQMNSIRQVEADIINEHSFEDLLATRKIYFFGNGSDKCMDVIASPNAMHIKDQVPLAHNMVSLAEKYFEANNFVDIAYFEPFYLKDFVATVPKNKVLPAP